MKKSDQIESLDQQIQRDIFNGVPLTRDEVKFSLIREFRGLHVFVSEVLKNDKAVEAITDTYYERYLLLRATTQQEASKQPENES